MKEYGIVENNPRRRGHKVSYWGVDTQSKVSTHIGDFVEFTVRTVNPRKGTPFDVAYVERIVPEEEFATIPLNEECCGIICEDGKAYENHTCSPKGLGFVYIHTLSGYVTWLSNYKKEFVAIKKGSEKAFVDAVEQAAKTQHRKNRTTELQDTLWTRYQPRKGELVLVEDDKDLDEYCNLIQNGYLWGGDEKLAAVIIPMSKELLKSNSFFHFVQRRNIAIVKAILQNSDSVGWVVLPSGIKLFMQKLSGGIVQNITAISFPDGTLGVSTSDLTTINCTEKNWQYANVVQVGNSPEKWSAKLLEEKAKSGCTHSYWKNPNTGIEYSSKNIHPKYIELQQQLGSMFYWNPIAHEWAMHSAAWCAGPGFRDKG